MAASQRETGPYDPPRARDFAIAAHGFQLYGGHPYVFHLDQVAQRVAEYGPLYETIAYLHDVLEDTGVGREQLSLEFGPLVARCVATLSDPDVQSREDRKAAVNQQLASIREGEPDWPALVVKVADRQCNVLMCEADGNTELLLRYSAEHSEFKAAAWRPVFRDNFTQIEEVFARHQNQGEPPPVESAIGDAVPQFIESYSQDWESYRQLAQSKADACEGILLEQGIKGIVSYRAKSPDRLLAKLHRRQLEEEKYYASAADIFEDIVDMAGVRVALYSPGYAEVLDALLRRHFEVKAVKVHAGDHPMADIYAHRFSGYWATHYRVQGEIAGQKVTVEIQVASLLMHAFSHVAHDLAYKPLSGQLSSTECALLDQLNGIVLAGEVALEQLHKATRMRIRKQDAALSDHFELGSWLTRWLRQKGRYPADLGRVDRLFALLREIERTRPSQIEPLMSQVDSLSPITDQLVERLLIEQPERADQWRDAVIAAGIVHPNEAEVAGAKSEVDGIQDLLQAWSVLEKGAARYLTGKRRKSFPIGRKRLKALELSDGRHEEFLFAQKVYRDLARYGGLYTPEQRQAAAAVARELAKELSATTKE